MAQQTEFAEFVAAPYKTGAFLDEKCDADEDITCNPPRQFANVIAMRQASGERCHIVSRCVVLCLLWPTDYRSHRQCAGQD